MPPSPEEDKRGFGRESVPKLTRELAIALHEAAKNLPAHVSLTDLAKSFPTGEYAKDLVPWYQTLYRQDRYTRGQVTAALRGLYRGGIRTKKDFQDASVDKLEQMKGLKDGRMGFFRVVLGWRGKNKEKTVPLVKKGSPEPAIIQFPHVTDLKRAIRLNRRIDPSAIHVETFFEDFLTKISDRTMTGQQIYDAYSEVLADHKGQLGEDVTKIARHIWFEIVARTIIADTRVRKDAIVSAKTDISEQMRKNL